MTIRSLLLSLLAAAMLPAGIGADSTLPHVRPLGQSVGSLLETGRQRSPTFRNLIDTLDRAPLIVHVEQRLQSPGEPRGLLRFVARAGGYRYLRITLDRLLPLNQAVALLGHELQHAVEVVRAEGVIDPSSFEALYQRIGEPCASGRRRFDTAAARRAGQMVLDELRGNGTRRGVGAVASRRP